MGFTRNRTFRLKFEDPSMDGLEVVARSVKLKQVLRLMKLADKKERSPEQIEEMLDLFQAGLVSWNVEDDVLGQDGQPTGDKVPVPANRAGIDSQEFDFIFEIILAWMDALMGVSSPLGKRLPSGATSLEGSIPMETLSPNQPS